MYICRQFIWVWNSSAFLERKYINKHYIGGLLLTTLRALQSLRPYQMRITGGHQASAIASAQICSRWSQTSDTRQTLYSIVGQLLFKGISALTF